MSRASVNLSPAPAAAAGIEHCDRPSIDIIDGLVAWSPHSAAQGIVDVGGSRASVHLCHAVFPVIGVRVEPIVDDIAEHVISNATADVIIRVEDVLRLRAADGTVLLPTVPEPIIGPGDGGIIHSS